MLILLAVTISFDLPGLKGIVLYASYRKTSLLLGVIFVLLATLLYYLPPQKTRGIPDVLRMPLLERKDKLLGRIQKEILGFIEEKTISNSKGIQQDTLEQKFSSINRA
ncbi:MAG: hypothetical protein ACHBN1_35505 [Heteroscytonema crispum UTEX LB 1556]